MLTTRCCIYIGNILLKIVLSPKKIKKEDFYIFNDHVIKSTNLFVIFYITAGITIFSFIFGDTRNMNIYFTLLMLVVVIILVLNGTNRYLVFVLDRSARVNWRLKKDDTSSRPEIMKLAGICRKSLFFCSFSFPFPPFFF